MSSLGVVMIVKDEEDCLAECLESVRAIADEIIIGDTGSTDRSLAICRQFGARVLEVPWNDDFSRARNTVLAAATTDWLLHLDADEVVDPAGAKRIRAIVDADGFGADAVEVTLANYCDTPRAWRWVPVEPDDPAARGASGYIATDLLRLFRNGCAFEYREAVHENITESVLEHGGKVRREPIIIHHYGYATSPESSAAKAAFYLDLARKKVVTRPEDPKCWHDRAEQALACGHAGEAEDACRQALRFDPRHLGAATTLANILLNEGVLDEAKTLFEALEADGISPPHVVTTLGAIACRQGRLDEAQRRLEAVLDAAPKTIMAHLYLARTLDLLEKPDAARAQLERVSAIAPGLDELRGRLESHRLRTEAERLFEKDEVSAALSTLVEALRLDPEDPITQNDLGVVAVSLGDTPRARECFERALQLVPGLPQTEANLRALADRE